MTNIPNPPILKDIDDLLAKLGTGGAPREQVDEVLAWKKKAQDALALLSLKNNVGVAMLVAKAEEEIREIEEWKIALDPKDLTVAACQKLVSEIVEREHMRKLWKWLVGMFAESETDLAEVKAEIEAQAGAEPYDED